MFDRHRWIDEAVEARDFATAMMRLANEERHEALWRWWTAGLEPDELRSVILDAWDHGPRQHGRDLREGQWLCLFAACGFVSEPDPVPAPTQPLTVWRGAPAVTRGRGMSWTLDLDLAHWFSERWRERGVPAETYEAVVGPAAVLAFDNSRSEWEVIVNPRRLPRARRVVT